MIDLASHGYNAKYGDFGSFRFITEHSTIHISKYAPGQVVDVTQCISNRTRRANDCKCPYVAKSGVMYEVEITRPMQGWEPKRFFVEGQSLFVDTDILIYHHAAELFYGQDLLLNYISALITQPMDKVTVQVYVANDQ